MTGIGRQAGMAAIADWTKVIENGLVRHFSAIDVDRPIVVAVSGGPDSIALLYLAARVLNVANQRSRLVAVSVDHGLRTDSADDARLAAHVAESLDVQHRTLRWEGRKPTSGIHASARQARYRLLIEVARSVNAGLLLTAHHQDDQAETVFMRLLRTPSLRSLSAVAPLVHLSDGLIIARPLLLASKQDLKDILLSAGLQSVADPANTDRKFERSRLRPILQRFERAGLTASRLASLADHARTLSQTIERQALAVLAKDAHVSSAGRIRVPLTAISGEPSVAHRILARLVVAAGGADRYPVPAKIERLVNQLSAEVMRPRSASGKQEKRERTIATLSGARLSVKGNGLSADLILEREFGRIPKAFERPAWEGEMVWDRRFHLAAPEAGEALEVTALGHHRPAANRWATLPIAVTRSHPDVIAKVSQQLSDRPGLDECPVVVVRETVSRRLLDPNLATLWEFVELKEFG